ncbi:MAG: hypothetical protein JSU70_10450 [Phycisphaerales bacterium]|nr:MAG: hypothetical protein JSU70_10450 [Phycisphaerales bacterium]
MALIVNNRLAINNRKGVALLVVLGIVMAITILSLGFLSRSDVELACGQNMILRTQMDSLAESGLEHAKGLILNPQDIDSEYWTGATSQQLIAGSGDYYDVAIVLDESNPADRCNYTIDCNSYRLKGAEQVGRTSFEAKLRLDPCVALWTGSDVTLWSNVQINGDVYCGNALFNKGWIGGDVFAQTVSGSIAGQGKAIADLSLVWPRVTVSDFTSRYGTVTISSNTISAVTYGPYDPVRVCYCNGSLVLAGDVQIEGMLLVDGDLTVCGDGNVITAGKNLPALLVTGDTRIEAEAYLEINGLAVVDSNLLIAGDATTVNVLGGLFIQQTIGEVSEDSSGNDHFGVLCSDPTWRPSGGQISGALEFDGVDDTVRDSAAGGYLNGLAAATVSVWVKSDIVNEDRGIMVAANSAGNSKYMGIRYDQGGSYGGAARCIKAFVRIGLDTAQVESSAYVQTTAWQHLAMVWESGQNVKLYINGIEDSPSFDSGPISGVITDVATLLLGVSSQNQHWDGLIDDLRIYNRVLDANDIYPQVDGLPGEMLHWRLDGGGSNVTVTAAPTKAAVVVWSAEGARQNWGQAAGAFLRSIKRR